MQTLDLTKVPCPQCFLYAKLALEDLNDGARLAMIFSNKEQALDVKASCAEEGFGCKSFALDASGNLKLYFKK